MDSNKIKIAFIGWNPFQLIHVSALIKSIPNSRFILENKHNSLAQFDEALLTQAEIPITVYKSKDIHKLDNLYNIIVCQTAFTDIHKFEKAKIAMIQYGYAKEAHNYGPWRSLADICFTYGTYASDKISYFCPTLNIGFLRHKELADPEFIRLGRKKYNDLLKPNKKTILYLPTWGDLNSSSVYLEKIISLKEKYNVLIKNHHNTELFKVMHSRINKQGTSFLGANDDSLQLIALSDIIISDFSGAIFDAIYCKKPVILLGPANTINKKNTIDPNCLEYRCRDNLGLIVNSPEDLNESIAKILLKESKFSVSNELYDSLFSRDKDAHKLVMKAFKNLCNRNNTPLTQQQMYVRHEMKKNISYKYSSLRYRAINMIFYIYSKATDMIFAIGTKVNSLVHK